MIQARLLQRSSHRLKGSHGDFAASPKLSRNFSSTLNRTPTSSKLSSHSSSRPHISLHRQLRLSPLAGRSVLRFASNQATPTPVAEFVPDYAPPQDIGQDLSGTSLDKVLDQLPAAVYEYPGWLRDIGLDYGWGTTALTERLLEYVHMYTGTPWWASTLIVIVTIRTLLLKPYFDSADTMARYRLIKPLEAPLQERYKQALRTRDPIETKKIWSEMSALRTSAGMVMWKQFVPLLVQIPMSFSLFRLMRGMSTLPAPGFDTGGFLWVKDLTMPDPYFIIPMVQTVALYGTIALGGETASNPAGTTTFQKFARYFLPGISGVIVIFWPAGMQLSFCITAIFSLIQSRLLGSNAFRKFIGIQQLGQQPYESQPSSYKGTITKYQPPGATGAANPQKGPSGVVSELKSGASALWKQAHKRLEDRQKPTGRRTAAELKHAKAYDERRKREIALEREAEEAEKAEREERESKNRRRRRR